MTNDRETPLVARNFTVRLIRHGPRGGRGGDHELAVSHVVMPPFRVDGRDEREPGAPTNLVLQRGHTGSSELFELWRAERDRARFRVREAIVTLLDESLRPATSWHFTGCRIVSLDHSPLDALGVGVLMERLELSFEQVEQSNRGT